MNFSLNASQFGEVTIITKKRAINSNTNKAQGGIAGIIDKTDNQKKHISDTLEAGCYHNKKEAVEFMVKHSTKAINGLLENGVPFQKDKKGNLLLTKEGGHNHRRIAYVGDYTGAAIEKTLLKKVRTNPRIKLIEHAFAYQLLESNNCVYGTLAILDKKIIQLFAKNTIIATGGIGQVFAQNSNPEISTGDGISMAHKINANTQDLEFIQFHPSTFRTNSNKTFLISETLRGEGAYLLDHNHKRFMPKIHPLAELAPRDIVAKTIFEKEKKGKVYLDLRHKNKKFIQERFPKIYKNLLKNNLDLSKNLIPISPAAHYLCGGIEVNLKGQVINKKQKIIKNLFAFGESAYTGVHGANRLASNSLLEAVVFSNEVIKRKVFNTENIQEKIKNKLTEQHLDQKYSPTNRSKKIYINKIKKNIQQLMWKNLGIIRTKANMKYALDQLQELERSLQKNQILNEQYLETQNILTCAILITQAALKRKKSLGGHYQQTMISD